MRSKLKQFEQLSDFDEFWFLYPLVCIPENRVGAVVNPTIPAGFGEVKAKGGLHTHKIWLMGVLG